ncbi:MAG: error-prone DNA polymerase [Acidobacteriota bacterium]
MTRVLPYCELHAHSAFSFLEGACEPETLAERAQELALPAVALVDRGGVYGLPRFAKACREVGVEALAGAEVPLEDGSRLPLLVRDPRGWSNLCRLLTTAALGRPKGQAAVSWEQVQHHAAGLLALTGWEEGPLLRAWRRGGEEAAGSLLAQLVACFGKGNLAVEVCRQLVRGEERAIAAVVRLARRFGLPLVATTNALLAREEDGMVADCFTCLKEKTTLDQAGKLLAPNRARVLRGAQAMSALFSELPEAVSNTVKVAERCTFRLSQLPYRFPRAEVGPGRSEAEELRARVWEGAKTRYRQITPRVQAQLERELALIEKLSLSGYFLVVHDIVRFCQKEGIMVQGRGSAANSAVCYALSITNVDPIAYDLLFERFLSEERGEWPDIDLDLPSGDEREKVIQHVYRTYGERGAGMTAVVVCYRARAAVREAGKVLGFDPERLEKLSAMLSGWGFERDPREELPQHMRAVGLDPEERRGQHFVELVARLSGLPRHLGQHTGGMVLAAGRLDDVVPLEPASMPGRVVIQWDKDDCGDLGIIKVDLLGLGMMQVLEMAVPLIRQHEGVEVDYAHLPADDPAVYDMLCRADTVGVFQVESRAQMATLPRMQPRRFYDLVVEVAIIRPGPIVGKMVHPYLNRRLGREPVTYPHPDLKPILERTLGVPLFQEQLMRVAMVAAGFTGGQAEELRRAMGARRSLERMKKLERQLREGMAARGITGKAADDIVQGITSFALYGFPESHAASFALIAYASAYLKAHHPAAFYCALLSAWPMGFYYPATIVQDARRHGVRVLPVDVNCSQWLCTLERDDQGKLAVRLGFKFVKGLRREVAENLAREAQKQPFASVEDLLRRGGLNRRELEVLASIGACASLGETRRAALWQVSAFDGRSRPLQQAMGWGKSPSPLPDMDLRERYVADFEGTGLTVGRHPLHMFRSALQKRGVLSACEVARCRHGQRVKVGGVVIVRQRPSTAKGMCFATLEDESGFVNVVFTPDLFTKERATITTSALLEVDGVVQSRDGVLTVRALAARPLALATPACDSRDFH